MPEAFIPVANPKAQFDAFRPEIAAAVQNVLDSGSYILGEETNRFEEEFARFLGAGYCIGVASGTDALALALCALGIGRNDEVITVSHSAVATVAAIEQAGAIPVFADIDPLTRCLDPEKIPSLISPKTKAVLPVHIYGQPAPMEAVLALAAKHGLKAHGAEINGVKVGAWGDAAAFSFYPTKNLGAYGDGGAVVTNSAECARRLKGLREYGWDEHRHSISPGCNSRLDELQAAILNIKLRHLARNNERRTTIAQTYMSAVDHRQIHFPAVIENTKHAFHLFVVECDDRESLQRAFRESGIGTAIHYPLAIHQQKAYAGRIRGSDNLRHTESLYRHILTLPMYPELTDRQVGRICAAMQAWCRGT
jgi:dTDP-4-amino-4,6-dideoxygalactose transaminase